ncbi:MAG: DUF503 domain-containing protein [Firmicutes bacterium]|nr:DUF503 domain-containing protein [Bacillota bacterium]
MVVGICRLELGLYENASLKGKRRVIKSIIDRVRARYNVSVAEVGGHELWQRASLGLAFVSTDSSHVQRVLSTVVRFIEAHGEAEVTSSSMELV